MEAGQTGEVTVSQLLMQKARESDSGTNLFSTIWQLFLITRSLSKSSNCTKYKHKTKWNLFTSIKVTTCTIFNSLVCTGSGDQCMLKYLTNSYTWNHTQTPAIYNKKCWIYVNVQKAFIFLFNIAFEFHQGCI